MTMQKKRQKFVVALLALTVMASGMTPALANHKWFHHSKEEKAEMKQDFFKKINATPDQKKKIEALDAQYEAKREPLEQQMWDKKQALMSYVSMPNSDKSQAMQQHAEITDLKSQIGQLYIEQAYTQKSYLTPTQQTKAAEFYKEKSQEWKEEGEKEDKKESD